MSPTDNLSPALQKALSASSAGDSDSALEWFAQAATDEPASALPHFLLGSEYAALGDVGRAEEAFSNAVVRAPNFHIARYQLGFLQYTAGKSSVALVTWQPLLNLSEESPLPHWVLGFAALAQEHFEVAGQYFADGLARNTENPPMSADIQKIIAGIEALAQPTTPQTAHSPSIHVQTDKLIEDDTDANHFLISAYQQNRTTH